MAMLQPVPPGQVNPLAFIWGDNGQMLTPDQAAARQQVANAIIASQGTPQNVGEGLGAVGKALIARKYASDASSSIQQGRTQATQDIQGVLADPTKASAFLANDAYATDQQKQVAQAIYQQQLAASAPGFALDQQLKQTELEQAQQNLHKPMMTSSFDTGYIDPQTHAFTPIEADSNVVGNIVSGIESGNLAPNFTGMSRQVAAAVQAALAKDGYNAAGANIDYKGAEHHAIAQNSSQQLRLGQTEQTVGGALKLAGNLGNEWSKLGLSGQYTQLNRLSLEAAKKGMLNGLNPQAQTVATQLDAQINDIAAEIATVYKGGGTPTNEDLAQARTQLDAAMSNGTLNDMIANVEANMNLRRQSTPQAAVGQNGAPNRYSPAPAPSGNTTATGVTWSIGP